MLSEPTLADLLRIAGLNNTLLGLTLVYSLVNVPVAIWLLEGFVRRLPVEIEEAGTVDGAGDLGVLLRLVVPLIVGGEVVAVLYADDVGHAEQQEDAPVGTEEIDLLVRHASIRLENLTSARTAEVYGS